MLIALFTESVSLAHVSRSVLLTEKLLHASLGINSAQDKLQLLFASDEREQYPISLRSEDFSRAHLPCISSSTFLRRVWTGEFPYLRSELREYLDNETKIIEKWNPDLVIGDCRPTLAVSCAKAGVPYVPLVNAYWKPEWAFQQDILPPLSPYNHIEEKRDKIKNQHIFREICDSAVKPFNDIRTENGMSAVSNYCELMTEGTARLYPDPPTLFPHFSQDRNEFFIGILDWSVRSTAIEQRPNLEPRAHKKPNEPYKTKLFVCLGSSSPPKVTEWLINKLCRKKYNCKVALGKDGDTNNARLLHSSTNEFLIAPFFPASDCCKWSDITICNGGSPLGYIALSAKVPIIGITSNYDQALNMCQFEKHNLGLPLSFNSLSIDILDEKIADLLNKRKRKNTSPLFPSRNKKGEDDELQRFILSLPSLINGELNYKSNTSLYIH